MPQGISLVEELANPGEGERTVVGFLGQRNGVQNHLRRLIVPISGTYRCGSEAELLKDPELNHVSLGRTCLDQGIQELDRLGVEPHVPARVGDCTGQVETRLAFLHARHEPLKGRCELGLALFGWNERLGLQPLQKLLQFLPEGRIGLAARKPAPGPRIGSGEGSPAGADPAPLERRKIVVQSGLNRLLFPEPPLQLCSDEDRLQAAEHARRHLRLASVQPLLAQFPSLGEPWGIEILFPPPSVEPSFDAFSLS